ncbi:MAG: membrane dipeptidase [Vitreoscilla sp.]
MCRRGRIAARPEARTRAGPGEGLNVAHGTYDLVRQASSVTDKPLVLPHTSLAAAPGPHSRLIAPDHARAIAGTGGVIGIWPPASIFPDLPALAVGVARMADVVGIEHVALGSGMNGLVGPSTFASYRDLPALTDACCSMGSTQATCGASLVAPVLACSVRAWMPCRRRRRRPAWQRRVWPPPAPRWTQSGQELTTVCGGFRARWRE